MFIVSTVLFVLAAYWFAFGIFAFVHDLVRDKEVSIWYGWLSSVSFAYMCAYLFVW